MYRQIGLVPEREAVHAVPDRPRVRAAQRPAAGRAGSGRRRRPGDRHGRADRCRGPPDRHVLQGDAPAGQARRRARPRPAGAAARRAVQRHGPAPAAAHDGAAPRDGRRGPDDPVLVAHPRRGRAARRRGARRLRRPAGRVRRLPLDPPADDRPSAHVHGPLVRRPAARPRRCSADPRSSASSWSAAGSSIRTADYDGFTRALPGSRASARGHACSRSRPTDESLESVFSYLVRR